MARNPSPSCRKALAVALGLLASACFGQAQRRPTAQSLEKEDSLKKFLQNYVREPALGDDKTLKYLAAFVDLNGDRTKEAMVYLIGRTWCGSSGCNMLILARHGISWRVVTATTVARTPIRVLTTASNGWRDIGVWVQGGGIQPGYEAQL